MMHKNIPVLGIAAYSGTGKTTLLRKVLPSLRAHGGRNPDAGGIAASLGARYGNRRCGRAAARGIAGSSRSPEHRLDPRRGFQGRSISQNRVAPAEPRQSLALFPRSLDHRRCGRRAACPRPGYSRARLESARTDHRLYFARGHAQGVARSPRRSLMSEVARASVLKPKGPRRLSVADARARILAEIEPVRGTEKVALRSALGRVAAADVVSPLDVTAHTNAAVDGYALAGSELPAEGSKEFRVIGTA